MLAIKGIYDGKTIRPLATETLPEVEGEVPVLITFPGVKDAEAERRQRIETAERMVAERDAIEPLGCSVKDLIEEGRYR